VIRASGSCRHVSEEIEEVFRPSSSPRMGDASGFDELRKSREGLIDDANLIGHRIFFRSFKTAL
jgi:hypothetical protein